MKNQQNGKKNKKISIWIICAVAAAGLAAYALFFTNTSASGASGSGESEGIVSSEGTSTQVGAAEAYEESPPKPDDKQTETSSQTTKVREGTPTQSPEEQSPAEGQTDMLAPNWGEHKIETEVHYLLDSEAVLDKDYLLKEEFRNEFNIVKKAKTYGVAYFDGKDRAFERKGWINRIRMQEEKAEKGFELTYKMRYRISGMDVDSAVRQAAEDGFDLSGGKWEAEVEWGHKNMTLSVSLEKEAAAGGQKSIADLTPETGLSMVGQNMPAEERDWETGQWGISALESAQMAGPVYFTRYKGKFNDSTVQIEIWEIPDRESGEKRFITEISLKSEDCESAAKIREELKERLEELGILKKEDALKTQQVLDAFLGQE